MGLQVGMAEKHYGSVGVKSLLIPVLAAVGISTGGLGESELHSANSGEHQKLKAGKIWQSCLSPTIPITELMGNLFVLSYRVQHAAKAFADLRSVPAAPLNNPKRIDPPSAFV